MPNVFPEELESAELDSTEPEQLEESQQSAEEVSLTTQGETDEVGINAGPIPFEKHKKILENARRKATEEAEAKYAFFHGRDPQEAIDALQHYDFLKRDLPGYTTYLASNVPDLRSRLFLQQPQQQPEHEYPKPVLDQYTGQYFYSAAQWEQIRKLDEQKFDQKLSQAMEPLQQKLLWAEQQQQLQSQANQQIEQWAATLPYFDDLLPEITKKMQVDGRLSVTGAWRKAYDEHLPKLKSQERNQTIDQLKKKANANAELRPNASNGETGRRKFAKGLKGWEQAFAEAEKELGARSSS